MRFVRVAFFWDSLDSFSNWCVRNRPVARWCASCTASRRPNPVFAHRCLNDLDGAGGTQLPGGFTRSHQFALSQQADAPQSHQRPVQFQFGILGRTAPQLGPAEGLFERAKEEFNSPAVAVNFNRLLIAQTLFAEHARHQVHRLLTNVDHNQSQYQRRHLFLGRLVEPAINGVIVFPRVTQLLDEFHIGADANHEIVVGAVDRLSEVVPHKARICCH